MADVLQALMAHLAQDIFSAETKRSIIFSIVFNICYMFFIFLYKFYH